MAISVSFAIGAPCAGGEHMNVVATLDRDGVVRQRSFHITRSDVRGTPPTDEELQAFVEVALRLMANQTVPIAQMRSRIGAKTIDLTI